METFTMTLISKSKYTKRSSTSEAENSGVEVIRKDLLKSREHFDFSPLPHEWDQPRFRSGFPLNSSRKSMIDQPGAIEVFTDEYSITRPGNGRSPFLQTAGAGPCLVLTLYEKKTKTGLMAHVSAMADVVMSFKAMDRELRAQGVNITNMEARIVGGKSGLNVDTYISELKNELFQRGIQLVEEDTNRDGNITAVTLDTTTGELHNYRETNFSRGLDSYDVPATKKPMTYHTSDSGLSTQNSWSAFLNLFLQNF
ncbi:MAG: hypothetical protein A3I05_08230 [Deltaproteobacteria bacterium RIFCSPLOWO2_02_FULL_44_10]|nr:MAG: hypothetical protein A3I05_08230 [Deltaproteobacteria bacterium RIFCSPLOWO2_02_FULL_44_10]